MTRAPTLNMPVKADANGIISALSCEDWNINAFCRDVLDIGDA